MRSRPTRVAGGLLNTEKSNRRPWELVGEHVGPVVVPNTVRESTSPVVVGSTLRLGGAYEAVPDVAAASAASSAAAPIPDPMVTESRSAVPANVKRDRIDGVPLRWLYSGVYRILSGPLSATPQSLHSGVDKRTAARPGARQHRRTNASVSEASRSKRSQTLPPRTTRRPYPRRRAGCVTPPACASLAYPS